MRESGKELRLANVLYVTGLKYNLISVSTMEDKGYEVNFHKGSMFFISTGSSKSIGKYKNRRG
jgi:hypothetical protein